MTGKEVSLEFENRTFALWFKLQVIVQDFVSLFLGGERCLSCSQRTLRIPMCKNCLKNLLAFRFEKSCIKCGRQLVSEKELCSYCRESPVLQSLDGSYSIHGYQLWKKSLLFSWKLENKRNLSVYFAFIFYKRLKEIEKEQGMTLCVVPVPPRNGKIRDRGWDQVDELCYYLKKAWNVKVLYLLERLSKVQQKKLDRVQRLEGIKSSFVAKDSVSLRKVMKKLPEAVILADDVLTTGATVEACARELKKIGIKRVFSMTLFIVD